MKIWKLSTIALVVMVSLSGGLAFAAKGAPMKPELAAKREMVRKQEEQRITPDKRKAAAEALKAERMKVYQAKQAVKKSKAITTDNK